VNTGAPLPSVEVARGLVLHFQRKLHVWASNDAERRFRDLWNLVSKPPDVLMESRMRWKSHVRFGGRRRGNHPPKGRPGASPSTLREAGANYGLAGTCDSSHASARGVFAEMLAYVDKRKRVARVIGNCVRPCSSSPISSHRPGFPPTKPRWSGSNAFFTDDRAETIGMSVCQSLSAAASPVFRRPPPELLRRGGLGETRLATLALGGGSPLRPSCCFGPAVLIWDPAFGRATAGRRTRLLLLFATVVALLRATHRAPVQGRSWRNGSALDSHPSE
jgi:hypothetical protein